MPTNLPHLIYPKGLGEERAWEVHGTEIARDQGKSVDNPVAVVVEADDLPIRRDAGRGCQVQSAGKVIGGEATRAQQKAVGYAGDIVVVADDLSPIVDPSGHCVHGTGKVDRGEIAGVHQKSMRDPRRVDVGTNDSIIVQPNFFPKDTSPVAR
jgi:hypothetical protein